jgi:hypothetical protein
MNRSWGPNDCKMGNLENQMTFHKVACGHSKVRLDFLLPRPIDEIGYTLKNVGHGGADHGIVARRQSTPNVGLQSNACSPNRKHISDLEGYSLINRTSVKNRD